MTPNEMWDYLEENMVATEEELQLVANGWGHNTDTYETVLYVRTGYRSFDQAKGEDEDDE